MSNEKVPVDKRRMGRRELLLGAVALAGAWSALGLGRRYFAARPGSGMTPVSTVLPTRIYGEDAYPVHYRRPLPPDSPPARYPGFEPGTTLLKKGTVRREGAMPLPCDIVFDRDVPVTLRDGTRIYTDVFRPADAGRHPAIVAWSPYGKQLGGQWLDDVPFRAGVPLAAASELQKFEGPDPAVFVDRGYAVLNPDARGAYNSEGNITFWGRQLAEDGYDFIEWAAVQDWCSGKVGMAGNSWLAISQWFIAAERPPHLAAIAPWEGASESYNPGGIPNVAFPEIIIQTFAGKALVEDLPKMSVLHPLMDAYWQDKAARLERIDIPAYVVASYTNMAHTPGTFAGFRRLSSARKWLRVHNTQEWQDFNNPAHRQDLFRFFDHVLKGVDNGWDATPPVRLAVLDPGGTDLLDRPEAGWPLQRQRLEALFLAPDKSLSRQPPDAETSVRYGARGGDSVTFTLPFDRDTEITGYMKLRIWVEAAGSDDMDLQVAVEKLDADGRPFPPPNGLPPEFGIAARGLLRVSHRALDPARSTPAEPCHLHTQEQLLKPGDIVPVEIALWPLAMIFHAGERLSLTIGGTQTSGTFPFEFGAAPLPVPVDGGTFAPGSRPALALLGGPARTKPPFVSKQQVAIPRSRNRGSHIIHMGGRHDSHLLIPVVPT